VIFLKALLENLIESLVEMENKDLYNAIETLNREKDELRERNQFGFTIQNFIQLLKKRKFRKIVERLREKLVLKLTNRGGQKFSNQKSVVFFNNEKSECTKIAVYTCVVGKYDLVKPPLLHFNNVDYFLFTDSSKNYSDSSSFQVKELSEKILKQGRVLANRYIKFHPGELFGSEYDYSIYIDGNVRIVSDVRPFVNCVADKTGLAMHKHRARECVYDEAQMCVKLHRGNKKFINKLMKCYQQEKFPENFGMNEANLIVTDLKNENAIRLLDEWWNEFVRSETMRDQLVWPYVLWKNGFALNDVGCLGDDIYKNYKLEIVRHE
jgi:ribosomal protein L27